MLDRGEDIPPTYHWLTEKPFIRYAMQVEGRKILLTDTLIAEAMDFPLELNKLEELRSIYVHIPQKTEINDLFKTGSPFFSRNLSYKSEREHAIRMSIYENYSFPLKKKGIRQTYFQGFNHPETFETINYDVYKPIIYQPMSR